MKVNAEIRDDAERLHVLRKLLEDDLFSRINMAMDVYDKSCDAEKHYMDLVVTMASIGLACSSTLGTVIAFLRDAEIDEGLRRNLEQRLKREIQSGIEG